MAYKYYVYPEILPHRREESQLFPVKIAPRIVIQFTDTHGKLPKETYIPSGYMGIPILATEAGAAATILKL